MGELELASRAGIVFGGAGVAVLALAPAMIRVLKRAGAGQRVRDDGPQRHLGKEGTPTMGGVLIIATAAAAAAVGQWWTGGSGFLPVLTLLAVTLAFASIGAADDWLKITRGRSLGLRARQKLLLQLAAAALFIYALAGERALQAALAGQLDAGQLHPIWAVFWVVAIAAGSNAVNLSDGLDGLAAGLCTIAAVGFLLLGLRQGDQAVMLVAAGLGGSCLAFLAYNRHPAKLFMGDVGSLALGAALAAMAARLSAPLALAGLCLVPFVEELSVVVQVIAYKTTRRRVFRMSPLHHHFELAGWPEQRVVRAFWAAAALAAALVVWLSW